MLMLHRQAAVQAVMEFVQGASLAPIAKHLFLLDMALPKPTAADSKGKGKVCSGTVADT